MADNTTLNPGAAGDTIATDDIAGVKHQRVKVEHGADGSATDVSTASPLPVDQTNVTVADGGALPAKGVQVGGTDGSVFQVLSTDNAGRANVNINGTVTTSGAVTNAGTFAVQDSQKIADNAAFTDGTTPVQPAGYIFDEVAGTALTENDAGAARMDAKRAQVGVIEDATTRGQRMTVTAAGAAKTDGSGVTQPVSGTVSITANSSVNQAQVAGTTTDTNSGVKSAGTQRVVIATDQPQLTNAWKVDGSAVTQPVSATNLSVNQAQVAGTATSVNSGTKDAGTQRVILASDQTVVPISDNSGSLTVDAPVGTPVFTTVTPSATGGWSKIKYAAQTTTVVKPKGTAGTFGGYYAYNPNASVAYIQVFDLATATTVTLGTTVPDMIFGIPAGSAANLEITNGVNMALGMQLACTTTATGSTAPGTGLDLTILFK